MRSLGPACLFVYVFAAAGLLMWASDSGLDWRLSATILLCAPIPLHACFIGSRPGTGARYDIFQPGALVACTFYLYVLFPAVNNWIGVGQDALWYQGFSSFSYMQVLFYCSAGIVAFGVGYRVKLDVSRFHAAPLTGSTNKRLYVEYWWFFLIFFALIGICFKALHFFQVGGHVDILLQQLSPSARRDAGVHFSGYQIMAETFLGWSLLIYLFQHIRTTKGKAGRGKYQEIALIVLLVLTMSLIEYIFTGKRSAVIFYCLLPVIWWHYQVRRIRGFRAVLYFALALLLVAGFLFARVLIPLYVVDDASKAEVAADIIASKEEFYVNSGEFATFDMMVFGVENDERIVRHIGGRIKGAIKYNFDPIALTLVPRLLWKDKPGYEDLSHVFSKLSTGNSDPIGIAITIFGAFYVFGHIPGVIIGMFLVGVLFRWAYFYFHPWSSSGSKLFLYPIFFWIAFQYLRFGTLGFTWLLFLQSQFIGVLMYFLIRNRNYSIDCFDTNTKLVR